MLKEDSPPEFEFDEAKSRLNKRKHGIDFSEAQELWLDGSYVEFPARDEGETRWTAIGQIRGKHWSVVVTYREGRIRIISARRSRPKEVALYEEDDYR